jgi:hypothetical protein
LSTAPFCPKGRGWTTVQEYAILNFQINSLSENWNFGGDIMEELLVYAILLYEKLVTENEYNKRLDELFLSTPENVDLFDALLYLESETDIKKAIIYVKTHIDYNNMDIDSFGKIFMSKLKEVYKSYSDIREFASRMFNLWEGLPGNLQNIEPFWTLSYADEPLSWGDEEQTRNIYERMLCYYGD